MIIYSSLNYNICKQPRHFWVANVIIIQKYQSHKSLSLSKWASSIIYTCVYNRKKYVTDSQHTECHIDHFPDHVSFTTQQACICQYILWKLLCLILSNKTGSMFHILHNRGTLYHIFNNKKDTLPHSQRQKRHSVSHSQWQNRHYMPHY